MIIKGRPGNLFSLIAAIALLTVVVSGCRKRHQQIISDKVQAQRKQIQQSALPVQAASLGKILRGSQMKPGAGIPENLLMDHAEEVEKIFRRTVRQAL